MELTSLPPIWIMATNILGFFLTAPLIEIHYYKTKMVVMVVLNMARMKLENNHIYFIPLYIQGR